MGKRIVSYFPERVEIAGATRATLDMYRLVLDAEPVRRVKDILPDDDIIVNGRDYALDLLGIGNKVTVVFRTMADTFVQYHEYDVWKRIVNETDWTVAFNDEAMARAFGGLHFPNVYPYKFLPRTTVMDMNRVALLGRPDWVKGWAEACVALAGVPDVETYVFIDRERAAATRHWEFVPRLLRRVHYLGYCDAPDVRFVLRRNRIGICVLPSHTETFCFAAWDAAAAGCRIIAGHAIPGLDGCGTVTRVTPGNAQEIKAAIEQCRQMSQSP